MKLFIWEGDGVLTDWTNGMIVALANDLQEALTAIEAKCNYCMSLFPGHKPSQIIEVGISDAKADAWVCWGGG